MKVLNDLKFCRAKIPLRAKVLLHAKVTLYFSDTYPLKHIMHCIRPFLPRSGSI